LRYFGESWRPQKHSFVNPLAKPEPLATVSRKVSELEAHLRTRLVTRTSRRLTLTDAGRSYVASCKRILEEIGEAERAAAGEYIAPRGELIITAPIVFESS
jgi:DNA-binding transcriptional LysR family regulator